MRDYDEELRGTNIVKLYGVRVENGKRYLAFQVWDFDGACYDLTMFMVEETFRLRTLRRGRYGRDTTP